MNSNRGIFEAFPEAAGKPSDSPFASVGDAPPGQFSAVPQETSPFAKVGEAASSFKEPEPGKPAKLPERRKPESPFMMADPPEGFGFDAPAPATSPSPFTPAAAAPAKSSASSPFTVDSPAPAPNPFPEWGQPTPAAQASPFSSVETPRAQATPQSSPQATPQSSSPATDYVSDSSSIRQLELRAIFGVDRELSAEEILQRARSLPGIRGILRVGPSETAAIESLKKLVPLLGLSGPVKLYAGNSFVEFVREGAVLLAVQTDRGFAPGVRETLMIVARELGRLS